VRKAGGAGQGEETNLHKKSTNVQTVHQGKKVFKKGWKKDHLSTCLSPTDSGRVGGVVPAISEQDRVGGAVPAKKSTTLEGKRPHRGSIVIRSSHSSSPTGCPTSPATTTEIELWEEEMALLRPFFAKKRTAEPPKRKKLLIQADLD
jgi:hypothetical protein